MDIVVPLIRSPLLESVRDIVMEYIEQVTYCLYGYPAKKARVKHIEEHDAHQIDLTWEKAIQLFDIFKPDNLPEFNSYKFVFFVYIKLNSLLILFLLFKDWIQ